jgi:hypothetical protein
MRGHPVQHASAKVTVITPSLLQESTACGGDRLTGLRGTCDKVPTDNRTGGRIDTVAGFACIQARAIDPSPLGADNVAKVENRTTPKSRESRFLEDSAAAIFCHANTKLRGAF